MKNFYLLLGCLPVFTANCLSQGASKVIHISNIPAEGILLDKGWKFNAGDGPGYTKPDYDDSKWETIDPTLEPLNFANNFSEVNGELIRALVGEVAKGNYDAVRIIAVSLKHNEEKIIHHGKRADAIVKGMLQHSKTSTGIKEPTDINALCDEYLRLSNHGFSCKS